MDKDIEQFGGTFDHSYETHKDSPTNGFTQKLEENTEKLGEFFNETLNFSHKLYTTNSDPISNSSDADLVQTTEHDNHIFDIDTAHDGINPYKRASANLENKLVKDEIYREKIRRNSVIIPRTDLINIDNSYSIVKDAGPGSVLLSLSNLIDSAGTPDFNKYKAIKGNDYDLNANGACLEELKRILEGGDLTKLPRIFTLDENACADTDSSISRADLKLYEFIQEKQELINFELIKLNDDGTPLADQHHESEIYNKFERNFKTDPKFKNLYLMNFIWQINLYYCIEKCIGPRTRKKYSKGLGFLNRIVFSEFEKNKTSMTPIFSMNGTELSDRDTKRAARTKILEHISDVFLHLFLRKDYIRSKDYKRYIYQNKKKIQGRHAFIVSQSAIAKGIKDLLSRHLQLFKEKGLSSDNIQGRSADGTVLNADPTIKSLINIYFGFWHKPHVTTHSIDTTLESAVFMLRMLKFMGDRSHIVISKLIQKCGDDKRDQILLTLDRPLQVSVVEENLNGLFKLQAQHDEIFKNEYNSIVKPFSTYKSSRLLLYVPKVSFTNLVEIIAPNFVYTLLWDYLTNEDGIISELNAVFYINIVKKETKKCEYKATIKIRDGKYSTKIDVNTGDEKANEFFRNFAFGTVKYKWEYWDSKYDNTNYWKPKDIGCGFYSKFDSNVEDETQEKTPEYILYITGKDEVTKEEKETISAAYALFNLITDLKNNSDKPPPSQKEIEELLENNKAIEDIDNSSEPIQKLAKKFLFKPGGYKEGDVLRIRIPLIGGDDNGKVITGVVTKDSTYILKEKIGNQDEVESTARVGAKLAMETTDAFRARFEENYYQLLLKKGVDPFPARARAKAKAAARVRRLRGVEDVRDEYAPERVVEELDLVAPPAPPATNMVTDVAPPAPPATNMVTEGGAEPPAAPQFELPPDNAAQLIVDSQLLVKIDDTDYYTNFAEKKDDGDKLLTRIPPPLRKTPKTVDLRNPGNDVLMSNIQFFYKHASISDVIPNYTDHLSKFFEINSKEFYSSFEYEYTPILTKLNKTDECIIDIRKSLNYLLNPKKEDDIINKGNNNPFVGFYYRVCEKNDFSAPKTIKYLNVVIKILDRLQLLKEYSGQEEYKDIVDNYKKEYIKKCNNSPIILKLRAYDEYKTNIISG